MASRDDSARAGRYDDEVKVPTTQLSFLEEEISALRRRLADSPRQTRLLEERLREAETNLATVTGQNERLAGTLREARDQIVALKEEVDRLAQPPSGFGIFLNVCEDGSADVFTGGRKMRVSVSPGIELDQLKPGQEVVLNEALNVVIAQGYETIGEVVMLKEILEGGDRALVISLAKQVAARTAELASQDGESAIAVGQGGQAREGKSFFLNIKGPELLNKYVGETERHIRLVFQRAREKASEGMPVIVFFDEMDSIFRTRGSGVSSDVENTIVPQLLSEIDGVEGLENVIVIGASNREDMIDPAILRPGRLDVKIKIERPDAEAARDIFSKYLVGGLPLHPDDLTEHGGSQAATLEASIQRVVDRMYSETEENRFLEVTYANGDKEVLYFKDFNSGAMIENIVSRAKKMAIKEFLETRQKGIRIAHLLAACVDEFSENEDLPNTTNPDDWARISGKKGERIVYIRTLVSGKHGTEAGRSIDRAAKTGQYL